MDQPSDPSLTGVAETLLLPLYFRTQETCRPDALLKDDRAAEILAQMNVDLSRIRKIKMDQDDQTVLVMRNREFDRRARDFLTRHPEAVVVHIGCGLDARFERLDNGQVLWYDLDLPDVIALRRKYLGGDTERQHCLAFSAFDGAWPDLLNDHRRLPVLFLAEGLFMYFEELQVKTLFRRLRDHFPGAELVFDAFSPYLVRMNNLRFKISGAKIDARYRWGLKHGKDIEKWAEGIRLLDEWFPFDQPEPRLDHVRWMRRIPFLARVIGIYQYRLGENKP